MRKVAQFLTVQNGAIALSLMLAVGTGAALSVGGQNSILQQGSDALASFIERSPGIRQAADLLKGKKAAKGVAPLLAGKSAEPLPTQRALGKIFDTPPELALADMSAPLASVGPLALQPGPLLGLGNAGSLPGGGAPGGGFTGPPGFIVVPGPNPGDGGPPVIPPTPPDVVAPIPEPGVWMMMMIGLAFCGAALRRRNRSHRQVAKGSSPCV